MEMLDQSNRNIFVPTVGPNEHFFAAMVITKNMTNNEVLEEQHVDPMAMMHDMRREMETMRRKHEGEMTILHTENTLMKQKINAKGLMSFTSTKPGPTKQS